MLPSLTHAAGAWQAGPHPEPSTQRREQAVTVTSGATSDGGKLLLSVSVGGSVYRLRRQVCRIWDLTTGLRLGRRLLEETRRRFWTFSQEPTVQE